MSTSKTVKIEIHDRDELQDFSNIPTMYSICPAAPAEVDVCEIASLFAYDCNADQLCIVANSAYDRTDSYPALKILFSIYFDDTQRVIRRYPEDNSVPNQTTDSTFSQGYVSETAGSSETKVQFDTLFGAHATSHDWFITIIEGISEADCPSDVMSVGSPDASFVISFNEESYDGVTKDPADLPPPN